MVSSSLKTPTVIYVKESLDGQALINTIHAAEYLGVQPALLRQWRHNKVGPAYIKISPARHAAVLYRPADLLAFIQARAVLAERMPRPMDGRLPGGKNQSKARAGRP
jgi:hypothetical protein